MDDDTAAILSEIDYPPTEWEHADFHYMDDGSVLVEIEMEDGSVEAIVLPDHDAAGEVWEYCEDYDVDKDSDYEAD